MWQLLGLEDEDEIVFRHYIARSASSTEEISRTTGLSAQAIDSSRKRLITVGLLRLEPPSQVKAILNGPTDLIERLRNEFDAEHARKRSDLMQLESKLTRLINDQLLANPAAEAPKIDRIPSLDAATVRITELICNARAEVARLDPGTVKPWEARADPTIVSETRASQRGVDVRTIRPPSQLLDPLLRRSMEDQLRADIRMRVMAAPDIQLLIVDRRVAVLADHRRIGANDALLVRDGLLVHMMHHIFETWWIQANDLNFLLTEPEAAQPGEVNGEERVMLRLLSDGYKDETVAKKLGISVRTVRRKVSDVLRRMPADSRFQAGVLAVRRGWI